jgi:3-methyladenine DNA glycosylase/8-oxoguanine DNA glycosylase
MMFQIAGTAVFCCLTAGCGSSLPPPNDEWAQAQTDVGRAEAGGAPSVPDAKLHLQLAAEDLQKSRDLMGQDNRRAASLIGLARAEAQLALSLAKAYQATAVAEQAQEDLQKLKGTGITP